MGTWGAGISSNDTFEDIKYSFFELYNEGMEVTDITSKLIRENQELLEVNSEDRNNFWFAIALAQWDCKSLDSVVLEKVKDIIASGDDLKLWQELNASDTDIKKRKEILDQFFEKLSSEKKVAKKRKKKVFRDSIFDKGDCLVFKFSSGNYGGAFVLESEKQTEYGMNLIAVTDIDLQIRPTLEDFKKANVLVQKEEELPGKYKDRERVSWHYAQFFKMASVEFEVLGKLEVTAWYDFEKDFRGFAQWDLIPELLNRNETFIKERGKPEIRISLEKLRKKN